MATIKNVIRLQDKMNPVLRTMIKAMKSTTVAMASVDKVGNKAFDSMKKSILDAEAALEAFNSEVDNVSPAAKRAGSSFNSFKNPLVTAAALIYNVKNALEGIGKVTGVVDNFALTNARLNLMNDGLQTSHQLQDMIFSSSRRSRAEYEATADVVAKLGILAGENFKSTEEIVAFSELMNKSFKIGGASVMEQTSAMYQLTQAMAAGKLQGDEFRSIMENAPLLAEAIAKFTGKSKGQLKEMSKEGTITADIIRGALFSMAEEINNKYETLPKTFGDSMTQMKNDALKAFRPVIERLSEIANSEGFQQFLGNITSGIQRAATWVLNFMDTLTQLASWISANAPAIKAAVVGVLTGITTAYIAAKVAAMLYAIAQGAVNTQLLVMNLRLALVAGMVAGAVFLWTRFGIVGKVLAVILGVLAIAIIACTVAQYAFNASLWANPIVWVIAAIIALIAIIVVLVLWVLDLWKTNMDFKYGVIKIWNSILNFFDQVPIFFTKVGYGIADAFSYAKIAVGQIMIDMANGVIDTINGLITKINELPGVTIPLLQNVQMKASVIAEEEAARQGRANSLATMEAEAAAKAAARQAQLEKDRAADEAKLAEQRAKAEADKAKAEEDQQKDWEPDWKGLQNAAGNPKIAGGKIDKVGGKVEITDESIKMMRDVAAVEFINKYTKLQPNMTVTFGDVRETADVKKVIETMEEMITEAYAASLVNE